MLTLLDTKGHKLASWVEHEQSGSRKLGLLLPLVARRKGHETLRITQTGTRKPKTLKLTLTG